MNAERLDYLANQLRGVPIADIGRKSRELLREAYEDGRKAQLSAIRQAVRIADEAIMSSYKELVDTLYASGFGNAADVIESQAKHIAELIEQFEASQDLIKLLQQDIAKLEAQSVALNKEMP